MSERLPGMGLGLDLTYTPSTPRLSAVAVLYRRTEGGVEVFWVKREKALAFAGGFYAFPGGKLDVGDAEVPVRGASGEDAALRSAAARELFEEAGVLVAEGAEDQATVDALSSLGCDVVQGYHLCRPLPPEQLLEWLRERQAASV